MRWSGVRVRLLIYGYQPRRGLSSFRVRHWSNLADETLEFHDLERTADHGDGMAGGAGDLIDVKRLIAEVSEKRLFVRGGGGGFPQR
mgnify:CR=1 FL=1